MKACQKDTEELPIAKSEQVEQQKFWIYKSKYKINTRKSILT